jgi:prepilin-type N-terminal cleavage/methylation domain-containing protein
MKPYIKTHKAFSLIEVIFVLIILGVISSIGSSIIVQVYESYITQNALYKVTTKTELVANQIVNRLTYAIPISTISKVTDNNGTWIHSTPPIENTEWIQLKNIMFGTSAFRSIEWIAYDNDSFSASTTPAWSGVGNYNTSNKNILNTPGSNLALSREIIFNLSNGKVDLDRSISATAPFNNSGAIVFKQENGYFTGISEYDPSCMGLMNYHNISTINQNSSCIFPIKRESNEQFSFQRVGESKIITERYKLAWSAYAIVPEDPDGDNLWNLFLYSNYQPWNGENYKTHGTKKLLMGNVSVFKFTKNGGIIQFKLCASENIGETFPISTCKEKVVLR